MFSLIEASVLGAIPYVMIGLMGLSFAVLIVESGVEYLRGD